MTGSLPPRAGVCLRLAARSIEADLAALEQHRGEVDMAELAVDRLSPEERASAARFPGLAGLPVVLAVRRRRDGGDWAGDEAERASLIRRLIAASSAAPFALAELEDDLPLRLPGVRTIRSTHLPGGVPVDLEQRLRGLPRGAGELPKASVAVRGAADLVRLLEVAGRTRSMPKVLEGTGDAGLATRVLATRLGSSLCYAVPARASEDAADPDPVVLRERYRFDAIRNDTPVFGVIGNPVMHSLSPLIHNRGLAALGISGVYLPFPVDDLAAFMAAADLLEIRGLSVTVPHKEAVMRYLATRDPIVERIGACNTMVRTDVGSGWHGANTDAEGFLAPLVEVLAAAPRGRRPALAGVRAAVIGAGGASRAVVAALTAEGAEVLVLNRTPERARDVAERFAARWAGLDPQGIGALGGDTDLIVQASAAGMGRAGADPLPGYRFSGREIVYELVYAPRDTPFLLRAQAAGCVVIPGIRMLAAQARGQFRRFTGRDLPEEAVWEIERRL